MKRVPFRIRDFPAIAILTLILMTASQRLYVTDWALGLGVVLSFTFLGAVLGLALGLSRFSRPVLWSLGLGYSLVLFPLLMGWSQYERIGWLDRLIALGARLAYSYAQFFAGRPVRDPVLFIVFMALVFWAISLLAGYTLTRSGGYIGAVVPAGIVLTILQLYDMQVGDRVVIIGVYSFFCLLLLGRLTYLRKRSVWKSQHVWVSAEAGSDLNFMFGAAALVFVVVAWFAPVTSRPIVMARVLWENLTRPWQDTTKNLGRAVAGLQNHQVPTVALYGDTLALGQRAQTGINTFLRIRVPLTVSNTSRYYWRVRSYDVYQAGKWSSGETFDEPFTPGQSPLPLADSQGLSGKFTFTAPYDNLALLVTPARPIWVSQPSRLTFLPAGGGKLDPLLFLANPPVLVGQEYDVHANIYEPTVAQLRSAGTAYPAWVSSRYLQLPADLAPVIPGLARQIVAGADTPYDQAAAITAYLRDNITYSTTVGVPPAGEDLLVWFLFDNRKGFCNYFATAEVVLLRSLGIPARMAVGFAQGEFEVPNSYTVRQEDAHAWPEVYFPGLGWMEFEPTTSQPPLVRQLGEEASAHPVVNPTPRATPEQNHPSLIPTPRGEVMPAASSGSSHDSLIYLVAFLLIVFSFIIGAVLITFLGAWDKVLLAGRRTLRTPLPVLMMSSLERLSLNTPVWLARWAYLARLTPPQRAFAVVYRSLRWLGVKASPAQTPAEAAALLGGWVPQAAQAIHTLLVECQCSLYSRTPGDMHLARRAAGTIWRTSIRAAIQRRWQAFGGILRQSLRHKHPSG